MVDDIASSASPPPSAPVPRRLGAYNAFVSERRSIVYGNVATYSNRRTEKNRFPDSKLRKVLQGASFIAAHPRRYSPGSFNVESMKYFVIHRPGINPDACTLLNTLRTFTDFADGREAATHFVIGFNGEIIQMVDLADKAYHCSTSKGKILNSTSVGVELEGSIHQRFTLQQYFTLAKVIRMLHDLSGFLGNINSATFAQDAREKIVGHQEFIPKKRDPGYNFNYSLLINLIKDTPPTGRNSIFRPPVDPLLDVETSLQTIVAQAGNPGSVGELALVGATTQDAQAMQRAMVMAQLSRTNIANSAASDAQSNAFFMARKLAEVMQKVEMFGFTTVPVPLPGTNYETYIDYSDAMGSYVTKEIKSEDT